jgi:hypothetical protein
VRHIFEQLCQVLSYCHQQKPPLVVGNLRPDSIRLTRDGQVKLVGYGVNWHQCQSPWSALEHWRDDAPTVASDIYSLGATLYTLLTRRVPPTATELIRGEAELVAPDRLNPVVPHGCHFLIWRMLHASPAERPTDADTVLREFEALFVSTKGMMRAWQKSRRCPCGGRLKRGEEVCSHCGRAAGGGELEAPPQEVTTDETLPAELLPLPPEVRALVQVPAGFLQALSSRAAKHEEVMVVEVNSEWVGFTAGEEYALGSDLLIRLVVPLKAGADFRTVDGRVRVDKKEAMADRTRWLYLASFREMTPEAAQLLNSYKGQERRQARRFDRICQILSKDLPDYKVLTTDISATGMAFISSRNLPVGSKLRLTVEPDVADMPAVQVDVKVMSSIPVAPQQYRIGVRFRTIPEKSARMLRRFLALKVN